MTMHTRTDYIEGEEASASRPLLHDEHNGAQHQALPNYDPSHFPLASAPPASSIRTDASATPATAAPHHYPPINTAYMGDHSAEKLAKVSGKKSPDSPPVATYPPITGPPPPPVHGYPVNAPLPITGREQVWLVQTHHVGPLACPHCYHSGPLRRTREVGACAWLSSLSLCMLGFWPCFWLPFCCACTQDRVYHCQRCGAEIARSM